MCGNCHQCFGLVAQWVEHTAVNRKVIGSSPIFPSFRRIGQVAKTSPLHGGNMGSIPVCAIWFHILGIENSFVVRRWITAWRMIAWYKGYYAGLSLRKIRVRIPVQSFLHHLLVTDLRWCTGNGRKPVKCDLRWQMNEISAWVKCARCIKDHCL